MAALGDVTNAMTAESILASAMMWLEKLGLRSKNPIGDLFIVAEQRQAKALQKLHALLNDKWRSKIAIGEISRKSESGCYKRAAKT